MYSLDKIFSPCPNPNPNPTCTSITGTRGRKRCQRRKDQTAPGQKQQEGKSKCNANDKNTYPNNNNNSASYPPSPSTRSPTHPLPFTAPHLPQWCRCLVTGLKRFRQEKHVSAASNSFRHPSRPEASPFFRPSARRLTDDFLVDVRRFRRAGPDRSIDQPNNNMCVLLIEWYVIL